jgi:hypothetical protein
MSGLQMGSVTQGSQHFFVSVNAMIAGIILLKADASILTHLDERGFPVF